MKIPQEIKEFDVLHIQRKAAVKIAKFLKIPYCDVMDYSELNSLIKEKDEILYKLMTDFSSAYWNYYYYLKNMGTLGKRVEITSKEEEVFLNHLKEKNDLRDLLMTEIERRKKIK